jgi:hypothetical protein
MIIKGGESTDKVFAVYRLESAGILPRSLTRGARVIRVSAT